MSDKNPNNINNNKTLSPEELFRLMDAEKDNPETEALDDFEREAMEGLQLLKSKEESLTVVNNRIDKLLEEEKNNKAVLPVKKNNKGLSLLAIAASLVLLMGLFFIFKPVDEQVSTLAQHESLVSNEIQLRADSMAVREEPAAENSDQKINSTENSKREKSPGASTYTWSTNEQGLATESKTLKREDELENTAWANNKDDAKKSTQLNEGIANGYATQEEAGTDKKIVGGALADSVNLALAYYDVNTADKDVVVKATTAAPVTVYTTTLNGAAGTNAVVFEKKETKTKGEKSLEKNTSEGPSVATNYNYSNTNNNSTPPVVAEKETLQKNAESIATDNVYDRAMINPEQMPEYPGGNAELMRFLNKNIQYPKTENEKELVGKIILSFIVNEDGKVSNMKLLKGFEKCSKCQNEIIQSLSKMPQWKPGMNAGKAVKVKMNVPVFINVK